MKNAPRYPDFIVGGAPKSGTSSLYFWLSAHPSICGSKVKEPYFFGDSINRFNKEANWMSHGLESYTPYFEHCPENTLAFEATASYLYSKNAVEGLQTLPVSPKMIFVLRHPRGQMYSHYRMERYRIHNVDEPLSEYVKRGYVKDMWEYSNSIPMWLENYPNEKLLFVLFEDLMTHKTRVMKEISDFLDIDGSFYEGFSFEHRNETIATKSRGLHRLGLKIQPYVPHGLQRLVLPLYLKVNSSGVPEMTEEETALLEKMKPEFDREIQKVKSLLPKLPIGDHWENR